MPVPIYQAKAELFRTLGHPARIRILELLVERDRAVHELAEHIEIESSNLSAQLAVLRRAGLVTQRRVGHAAEYSITAPEIRDLLTAGRRILLELLDDQSVLRSALADEPDPGGVAAAAPTATPSTPGTGRS